MKKTLLSGVMALGLIFTGCKSDEPLVDSGSGTLKSDQTFYVSMTIKGDVPSMSRASSDNGAPNDDNIDFNPGSDVENQVNNAYFVFYDEDGNVVGDIVSIDLPEPTTTPVGGTVEKSYKSVVSVDVMQGEKVPAQVICYINPIQAGSLNVNLNTIQTVSRTEFASGSGVNQYFAMSNSVYYPAGEADDSKPQIAVPIGEGQLFKSESEAEQALADDNTVNIYVERYATKLQFEAVDADTYETGTRIYKADGSYETKYVALDFVPQYWAVNAQANRNYVIKSFREESSDGLILGQDYTYGKLNSYINAAVPSNLTSGAVLSTQNSWDWNNPDYHRSYWGMSPAYFTAEYPEVSQDVMDGLDLNQTYIKYNELPAKGFRADDKDPKYFRETTVGYKALHSTNPAAAVASVIYVGAYTVTLGDTELPTGTSFYTYLNGPVPGKPDVDEHPYVYFEDNGEGKSKVEGGESMLKRFLAQSTTLFKKVGEGDNATYERLTIRNTEDLATLVNAMKVDEVSQEVRIAYDGDPNTKLKLRNNARTLQFKNLEVANGIYVLTGNGYQEVVANNVTPENGQITLTEANLAIMRQVGYSYFYTLGHAYFNIPVKHLGWYRKGNLNRYDESGKLLSEETLDWDKVRVGDFGMVRNHSYSIKVSKILDLAPGIGGDDVPIVPPKTPSDYFMAYSVNILKWAVVPVQNTKL